MWNVLSCKSNYKEYLKQREDEKLSQRILNIKPIIDTSKPRTIATNFHKPFNKNRVSSIRKKQIKEENKSLLKRMLRIDLKAKNLDKRIIETASTKSLNKNFRLKQLEEIHSSNKNLTKRLRTTESVYSITRWEESNRFHNYVRDNITRNSGRIVIKHLDCDKRPRDSQGSLGPSRDELEEFN